MDSVALKRENPPVLGAGISRERMAQQLNAAYADGLVSQETHAIRLERVLRDPVLDPAQLVGDLYLRSRERQFGNRLATGVNTLVGGFWRLFGDEDPEPAKLLTLDWTGRFSDLVIGRSRFCHIVLDDPSVSRRHARLIFRDGRWIVQDLISTNGTLLNGHQIGRSQLRSGDELMLGDARLRID